MQKNENIPNAQVIGRFAPSPSGRFHVGNIFSSMIAALVADEMVLRIEDLDPDRSKQKYIDGIKRDLDWFGFEWSREVAPQSSSVKQAAYNSALSKLEQAGYVYPCFCTRADLHSARAPHVGEDYIYRKTCKYLSEEDRKYKAQLKSPSLRLSVSGALDITSPEKTLHNEGVEQHDQQFFSIQVFQDRFQGNQSFNLETSSGDFIIRRSDGVFAYQLAVVVDDSSDGVTSVVRGVDLLTSTPRQMLLQKLLGYKTPDYGHVPLFVTEDKTKLSKRNNNASLEYLIDGLGLSAREILGYLAFLSGLIPEFEPFNLIQLKQYANLDALSNKHFVVWTDPSFKK
jgi:glutamyl-tRNA synthetase